METALPPVLPAPPDWSIQLGNAGIAAVWIATIAFLLSAGLALFAPERIRTKAPLFLGIGVAASLAAMAVLATLIVNDRFEWTYVRAHSDKLTPTAYKIAAVWSGQEGSFLLWSVMSGLFALLALKSARHFARWYVAICALFLLALSAISLYETPFKLIEVHGKVGVPEDGTGLAPSLLNYWVVIHPPTIFAGFGSLLVIFAFALSALILRDYSGWVRIARPWALLSMGLLGLGLCMGGFWAYETLGWGGFWAWDPVENTSFVPWCLLAILVHGFLVQSARGHWQALNLLIGGLPFLSFVYGTFLTRSGFLGDTSVHSFAEMNRSALWILVGILAISLGSFLGIWFSRLKSIRADAEPAPSGLKRQTAHAWGNFALAALAASTAVGMSVPLIMSIAGQKPKVVPESLYHQVLPYFFIPLMLLMGIGPFLGWRKNDPSKVGLKVYGVSCITIAISGFVMLIFGRTEWAGVIMGADPISLPLGLKIRSMVWIMILAGICTFATVAAMWRAIELFKRSKLGVGGVLAHAGVSILMTGLILSRGLERHEEFVIQKGGTAAALGYLVTAGEMTSSDLTDRNNKVEFRLERNDTRIDLKPGLYMMATSEQPMVWPSIAHRGLHDVYFSLRGLEFDASEETPIKPGETKDLGDVTATYRQMTSEGSPGKAGATFGAILELQDKRTGDTAEVNPKLMLVEGGVEPLMDVAWNEYAVRLAGMDAGSKSVTIQLHFLRPFFFAELFIKPFTVLVWIGTGILTFATLLSALYRRPASDDSEREAVEIVENPQTSDALTPTAQG